MLRNGNRHFVPHKSAQRDKPANLACYTGLDSLTAQAVADFNEQGFEVPATQEEEVSNV